MGGNARLDQPRQCRQPLCRGRGARFEQRRQARVEAGDRDRHGNEPLSGHFADQVEIVEHTVRLGRDRDRMTRFETDFEQLAGDAVIALDRLVGIGIGPHRDRSRRVIRPGERFAQQVCRAGFGEQPGFEIEPRRQIVIGVRGAGEAIDTAVLAAVVGVDRAVEKDVGRLIER